ncbi:MAG: hypothetical protein ACI4F1_12750 [Bariatricus sp.]
MKIIKKTALNDDAAIYQERPEETEKEKWSRMSREQKKQYFMDYYLFKIVVGVLLIGIAVFLIWHFVGPKDETVLYVAVVDESLDAEKLEEMQRELNQLLGADGKHEQVIIDDTFYTEKDALTRMEVYLHSNQVDVIIAEQETYEEYAGYGFFQSMDEVLDENEQKQYQGLYRMAAGYKDTDDISFEDEETERGEEKPYGIDISGSSRFMEMKSYVDQPVLSIAQGTKHKKAAEEFVKYLMQEGED